MKRRQAVWLSSWRAEGARADPGAARVGSDVGSGGEELERGGRHDAIWRTVTGAGCVQHVRCFVLSWIRLLRNDAYNCLSDVGQCLDYR